MNQPRVCIPAALLDPEHGLAHEMINAARMVARRCTPRSAASDAVEERAAELLIAMCERLLDFDGSRATLRRYVYVIAASAATNLWYHAGRIKRGLGKTVPLPTLHDNAEDDSQDEPDLVDEGAPTEDDLIDNIDLRRWRGRTAVADRELVWDYATMGGTEAARLRGVSRGRVYEALEGLREAR